MFLAVHPARSLVPNVPRGISQYSGPLEFSLHLFNIGEYVGVGVYLCVWV